MGGGEDSSRGVGDALARDVGRGAVDRFEITCPVADHSRACGVSYHENHGRVKQKAARESGLDSRAIVDPRPTKQRVSSALHSYFY